VSCGGGRTTVVEPPNAIRLCDLLVLFLLLLLLNGCLLRGLLLLLFTEFSLSNGIVWVLVVMSSTRFLLLVPVVDATSLGKRRVNSSLDENCCDGGRLTIDVDMVGGCILLPYKYVVTRKIRCN
jgi:hypothetical protein